MEIPWNRDRWADALAEALGVLLPVVCLGCGEPDRAVCRSCRAELASWPRCVRLIAGVRLDAVYEYRGLVRVLLLALKLRGRVDVAGLLGRPTGALLRRALAESPPGTVVVRVPCSVAGRRRRGFDPVVLLLARGGVRWTGGLRRVRRRPAVVRDGGASDAGGDPSGADGARGAGGARSGAGGVRGAGAVAWGAGAGHVGGQKERSALERVQATVGTLLAVGVAGRDVLLVDDVVTTGVTMAEAVRAVRAGGGRVVRCVATASVEE